ncbi:MAG: hypothetical protein NVSMB17_19060 [Candidatus Dormibacteria bacterium]
MGVDAWTKFRQLEARWEDVATRHLPRHTPEGPWRYSAIGGDNLPAQGWKLHLSATILSATALLRRVGPILDARGDSFKGPRDLATLDVINSGIPAYSQVGKCITVYCRDDEDALDLAKLLDEATADIPHPLVPFDREYRPGSCVFYRYGAFGDSTITDAAGNLVGAVADPSGQLVPDLRAPGGAVPPWIRDPFPQPTAASRTGSPLAVDYRAFEALRQRGRGGVYRALDLTRAPARLCVIKEGLKHGETGLDGRDGYARVRNEGLVLRALARAGIAVPEVIAEFDDEGNRYLVLEHVEGRLLATILAEVGLETSAAGRLAVGLRDLVRSIHDAGWCWRDCKPENLVVTAGGSLRPLDFEGACRTGTRRPAPWSTPKYRAPLADDGTRPEPIFEDLHALALATAELNTAGKVGTAPV